MPMNMITNEMLILPCLYPPDISPPSFHFLLNHKYGSVGDSSVMLEDPSWAVRTEEGNSSVFVGGWSPGLGGW